MNRKTLVLGASLNSYRYSNMAILRLRQKKISVVAIGLREGKVGDVPIFTGQPSLADIHTVTLYLNPRRQTDFYSYILALKPQRVIFNPGTENEEFIQLLENQGIRAEIACTLVMLSVGNY